MHLCSVPMSVNGCCSTLCYISKYTANLAKVYPTLLFLGQLGLAPTSLRLFTGYMSLDDDAGDLLKNIARSNQNKSKFSAILFQ